MVKKTKKLKTKTKVKTTSESHAHDDNDGGTSNESDISSYQDLLVMIGDSDIAYWPDSLIPSISSCKRRRRRRRNKKDADDEERIGDGDVDDDDDDDDTDDVDTVEIIKRGKSGATLKEIIPDLQSIMEEEKRAVVPKNRRLIIVACVGENDIGNGISLDSSVASLQEFLDVVFFSSSQEASSQATTQNHLQVQEKHVVIFLGPKFEPWLDSDDHQTNLQNKQLYSKMSRNFERCCKEYNDKYSDNIHYIDCLTMFCTNETKTIPGAILGGKAKADSLFFQSDQLHLNCNGYQIWKTTIENILL